MFDMYTAKDLSRIFQTLFPSIVIEKWLPGGHKLQGGKRESGSIRIMSTEKKWYIFSYGSENNWMVQCCGYGPIKE